MTLSSTSPKKSPMIATAPIGENPPASTAAVQKQEKPSKSQELLTGFMAAVASLGERLQIGRTLLPPEAFGEPAVTSSDGTATRESEKENRGIEVRSIDLRHKAFEGLKEKYEWEELKKLGIKEAKDLPKALVSKYTSPESLLDALKEKWKFEKTTPTHVSEEILPAKISLPSEDYIA